MLALPAVGTLSLLLLAASIQLAKGQTFETCGASLLGFSGITDQNSYQSPSDTCDLELIVQPGLQDSCTATSYYSWIVQYIDINGVQQNVPSLNTITYTGPPGSIATNYFDIPFTSIQNGDPIVATFTESGAGGVGTLAITWTQEPLVVTSNTVATTTVTDTTDVSTTSTSTITSSSTVTVTPQATVVTTTVGTATVTAPTSTTTTTSTITPRPKTEYGIDIIYEKTQLPCNPFNKRSWRRSLNLKERQQAGTCYEFPDFTDTQTTTTITTSTSVDYTTVTTTDTITDSTISTVTTTTTAVTPTSYDDVTATVTTTPVTTSTVYTKAHRSTTTEVKTVTIEIPVFPKSPPCYQHKYGGPPHPGGPSINCPGLH